ncbi:MAG: hypothetical protein ACLTXH_03075 [Enterobacter hormaechei]
MRSLMYFHSEHNSEPAGERTGKTVPFICHAAITAQIITLRMDEGVYFFAKYIYASCHSAKPLYGFWSDNFIIFDLIDPAERNKVVLAA